MAIGKTAVAETVYAVDGIQLGVTQAEIKYSNRKDLVVLEIPEGATVAATFTQNRFCASPVEICKKHLAEATPRYLLINTGYANAGNGQPGYDDAMATCEAVAKQAGVAVNQILPFSTGVIGEPLPVDRIVAGLPACFADFSADNWVSAAEGIMTTDTRPKVASVKVDHEGESFVITGMSKGSGMIKPNMATMLGYIATDLKVPSALLQETFSEAVEHSFNCVSVDGDTSTNDSCILVASGKSSLQLSSSLDPLFEKFKSALQDICLDLAQALIKDGEGVTKFVEILVEGGASKEDCKTVAYTVAHSPLVKTALFASDPNWGRILAAVGRAEIETLDVNKVNIWLGDVALIENGGKAASYQESAGAAVMEQEEILIRIDLGVGDSVAKVWTTDFSYDYVKINAEYRS